MQLAGRLFGLSFPITVWVWQFILFFLFTGSASPSFLHGIYKYHLFLGAPLLHKVFDDASSSHAGNTGGPCDIGVSKQEPILEPGALESPASLEPTSMGKPGAKLSSLQSSCWVTGEVMPLERPTKLELLEPSVAGNVMGGTAKAVSAYAGGVLAPGVEEANLETRGLNSSLYPKLLVQSGLIHNSPYFLRRGVRLA